MSLVGSLIVILPPRNATISQKLKEVISNHSINLGETPNGRDWCLKALHPSDPLTEVRGIPDESSVPSLLMNYQSVFTLKPADAAVGTWNFDMSILPHIVAPLFYAHHDSTMAPGATVAGNFLNPQLDGANAFLKYASLLGVAQRWRLAYMGVTCHQDGADMTNQGTICVAQYPVAPKVVNYSFFPTTSGGLFAGPHVQLFSAEDYPSYDASQSMPNAYFANSKFGAYVPLRLTKTHQEWQSEADQVCFTSGMTGIGSSGTVALPTTAGASNWPFPSVDRLWIEAATSTNTGGQVFPPLASDCIASVCAKNLAVTTSFTFYVRMGWEMQVSPTSMLAPQLKLSPPLDRAAVEAYFKISREMKDAYPGDYNFLGKLWEVISSIAKVAAPALTAIPVVGPALAAGVPLLATVGDSIKKAVDDRAAKTANTKGTESVASAADVERTREMIREAGAARQVRTRQMVADYVSAFRARRAAGKLRNPKQVPGKYHVVRR